MIENKLKFGQRVTVYCKYSRHWTHKIDKRSTVLLRNKGTREFKFWKVDVLPINKKTNKSARSGIFLGYRHLANGFLHRSYDEGTEFEREETFKVALVCLSECENPIYVPLENIK